MSNLSLNFAAKKTVRLPHHCLMNLQDAVICVECETVSDSRGDACPGCGGSGSLMSLAKLIGARDGRSRVWVYPDETAGEKPGERIPTHYAVEESDR